MPKEANRLENLDVLRGLAALFVCFFHFNTGNFLGGEFLYAVTGYGHLGVQVFFVISGFVIPYSLWRVSFRLADFPIYLTKRIIRLYPVYLITIALALGLWLLSSFVPGFAGGEVDYSFRTLSTNLSLSSDLLGSGWYVPVFWTLAIEAQYYLIVAFFMLGFSSKSIWVRHVSVLIWILFPLMTTSEDAYVFVYMPLFGVGICYFMGYSGLLGWPVVCALISLTALIQFYVDGLITTLAALFAVAFISRVHFMNFKPLMWLGSVSYSLYLVHVPLGGRITNLAERFPDNWAIRLGAMSSALLITLVAAAIFYRYLEKPSHVWAQKLKFRR